MVPAAREPVLAQGGEEIGLRGRERVDRREVSACFSCLRRRQRGAILVDEAPERRAVALPADAPGEQGKVEISPRLIPRAESARRHIFGHALRRAPEPRVFPVVDGARAIRGEMRDPAALHQLRHEQRRAIAEQVRAVDQDDRRARGPGRHDPLRGLRDQRMRYRRRRCGIDEDILDAAKAAPFLEWENAELAKIETHGASRVGRSSARQR